MNADVKKKWIEDLRTPGLSQVTGALEELDEFDNPIGHCCLGRLCRLAIANGAPVRGVIGSETQALDESEPDGVDNFTVFGDPGNEPGTLDCLDDQYASALTLPLTVQSWAGLTQNPIITKTMYEKLPEDLQTLIRDSLDISQSSIASRDIKGEICSLAELNDKCVSFANIANIIEACF